MKNGMTFIGSVKTGTCIGLTVATSIIVTYYALLIFSKGAKYISEHVDGIDIPNPIENLDNPFDSVNEEENADAETGE